MEKMIENQKEILQKLSEINLNEDENIVFENFKKILEINNVLRTNVKSTFLKTNENKVGEVYKYYFG